MQDNDVEAYLSPRFQINEGQNRIQFTDTSGTELAKMGTMNLKFIDTEQEKKIDLGISWPFEKLKRGECIISTVFEA